MRLTMAFVLISHTLSKLIQANTTNQRRIPPPLL